MKRDNIKMELKKIRWEDMQWIHVAEDRGQWKALTIMVTNLWVPLNGCNTSSS
jgi:hypothetical protein